MYCKKCKAETDHRCTAVVTDVGKGQTHRYYKCLVCGNSQVATEEVRHNGN